MKTAISLGRFFSRCAPRNGLYYCNAFNPLILSDRIFGKTALKPGLAVYATTQEYQRFIKGNAPPAHLPIFIYFST